MDIAHSHTSDLPVCPPAIFEIVHSVITGYIFVVNPKVREKRNPIMYMYKQSIVLALGQY